MGAKVTSAAWAGAMALVLLAFYLVNPQYTATSSDYITLSDNYTKAGCGPMARTAALTYNCLLIAAWITGPFMLYIFSIYRNSLMPFKSSTVKVYDGR